MNNKKVIVTGADGFIGRYLTWRLLSEGYTVVAIVMDIDIAKEVLGNHENLDYIECLMADYPSLADNRVFAGAECVYHLAWAGVSDEKSVDYNYQLENVRCSCNLLTASIKAGVKRFLFAGSLMEFEHKKAFENGFYNVSMRNIYHSAKSAARNILQIIANNNTIDFRLVTISNVYGVGEKSRRLINTAIRAFVNNEYMSFTPAQQIYDFIYIEDAAHAIALVGESGKNNKNYYIGNKEQKPLKDFLLEMRDIVSPGLKIGIGDILYKGVSLDYTEFDTQGLYEDFDFKPEYSFSEGLRKTSDWLRNEK